MVMVGAFTTWSGHDAVGSDTDLYDVLMDIFIV